VPNIITHISTRLIKYPGLGAKALLENFTFIWRLSLSNLNYVRLIHPLYVVFFLLAPKFFVLASQQSWVCIFIAPHSTTTLELDTPTFEFQFC